MPDPYASFAITPSSPGTKGAVITPGPDDLATVAKALITLSAGDVTIVPVANADGATLAFVGLAAGTTIPFRVRRVTAATATVAAIFD